MSELSGQHVADALVYDSDDQLVTVAAPFLWAGLDAGEAVVLVCAERRNALIAAAVADERLVVLPAPQVWRRPTDAMHDYQRLIEAEVLAGRRVRIVADSDFGHGPADWSEWARFEAASHHASRLDPVWSICALDRRDTPPYVLAATERLHPVRYYGGARAGSRAYADAAENVSRDAYVRGDPMTDMPPTLSADDLTAADLTRLRTSLGIELGHLGLPPWRLHEFLVAVSETVANAISHGRAPVRLQLWSTPRRVLCTVTDHGAGFDYPLSSYLPVDPGRAGLGLYLARQLSDQVNICWTPDGFTVRLVLLP